MKRPSSRRSPCAALAVLVMSALWMSSPSMAQAEDYTRCPRYEATSRRATVFSPLINEASGLAASRQQPGVFWTHNDSGDGPTLYALDAQGQLLGQWTVSGAKAVDWEDMALGVCEDGQPRCLYIGDFGNNAKNRTDLTIYRVEEPTITTPMPGQLQQTAPAQVLPFKYPFGADDIPDAESMFVSPAGRVYVITKENQGRLVALPKVLTPGQEMEAELLSSGGVAILTAADMRPDGLRIALRNYLRAYELEISDPEDLSGLFDAQPARVIPFESQPQGESIAYGFGDGFWGLWSLSEKLEQPLMFYPCIFDEVADDPQVHDMGPGDMGVDMGMSVADLGMEPAPLPSLGADEETSSCACSALAAPRAKPSLWWLMMGVVFCGAGALRRRGRVSLR